MADSRSSTSEAERLRRWRLVLGEASAPGRGSGSAKDAFDGLDIELDGDDLQIDRILQALYDSDRRGGLGSSSPKVNRWLGDIRKYFSESNVRMLQKDALQRLNLQRMLLEPETLEQVEADVQLAATLLSLKGVIPKKTLETARQVVRKVVKQVEERLRRRLVQSVHGAISKISRTSRPRSSEIDWNRTIRKNLKNYLPAEKIIIPEQLVGYRRRQTSLRDVILCVDQSGSMATSVVYSGIFASVLASLRSLQTKLVVFDTEVVDLSDQLDDPVDLLFGIQLGGGTDINRAIAYCRQLILRPTQTTLVLVSDLQEGGDARELLTRMARLTADGVQVIVLLALNDEGVPAYHQHLADAFADLEIPSFACTPDLFPDFIAAALQGQSITSWAARHEIVVQGRQPDDVDHLLPSSMETPSPSRKS